MECKIKFENSDHINLYRVLSGKGNLQDKTINIFWTTAKCTKCDTDMKMRQTSQHEGNPNGLKSGKFWVSKQMTVLDFTLLNNNLNI